MKVGSKEQAVALLQNISNALDQLVVQGHNNCFIIVACHNDIENICQFLNDKKLNEVEFPPLEALKGDKHESGKP